MLHTFIASNWLAVLAVMLAVVVVFVFVAGRGAEGGFGGRASKGWGRWMAISHRAAELQARIVLTLFYFTLAAPFGILRTLLADPLRAKRANQPRAWFERTTRDRTLDDARRQF